MQKCRQVVLNVSSSYLTKIPKLNILLRERIKDLTSLVNIIKTFMKQEYNRLVLKCLTNIYVNIVKELINIEKRIKEVDEKIIKSDENEIINLILERRELTKRRRELEELLETEPYVTIATYGDSKVIAFTLEKRDPITHLLIIGENEEEIKQLEEEICKKKNNPHREEQRYISAIDLITGRNDPYIEYFRGLMKSFFLRKRS